MAQFDGNTHWASDLTIVRLKPGRGTRPSARNCKNEYIVFALGNETAAQTVVGCIVWVLHRLKNQGVGR